MEITSVKIQNVENVENILKSHLFERIESLKAEKQDALNELCNHNCTHDIDEYTRIIRDTTLILDHLELIAKRLKRTAVEVE